MEDFEQIAKLNLESILLELKNDGTQFLEKIKEILVACEGTSKIRITYFRECENKAEFEEYMSEWLYKNVEVKSICCRDDQLNSCFSFGIEWDEI
uniref:Uncharacterized protein n=1 Tax=Panagrolaimus sp. ES5 TaxID=591445 RepID=A0AC34G337_9BILA